MPGEAEEVAVDWVDNEEYPGNVPASMARDEECCRWGGRIQDIQIHGATAFEKLPASKQVVSTFFLWEGDWTGLVGASIEGITDGQ